MGVQSLFNLPPPSVPPEKHLIPPLPPPRTQIFDFSFLCMRSFPEPPYPVMSIQPDGSCKFAIFLCITRNWRFSTNKPHYPCLLWQKANARNIIFRNYLRWQSTLSTLLIKTNYLVTLQQTEHHSFFRILPPNRLADLEAHVECLRTQITKLTNYEPTLIWIEIGWHE